VHVREAGYDGVELHAAHGYLIAQFLSASSNRRDDAYGGELPGRMRFLEEIIAGIRARCGGDCVLGVRLSADEEIPDGMHLDDTLAIVRRLSDAGAIDYLSITLGQRGAYVKDISHPEGVAVAAARAVKQTTTLPVLVAGRIVDPVMAETIVRDGSADLVGMARQLIVDPQWPAKVAAGITRSIRPCIGLNQECRTFPGGILCAASARTGREAWFEVQSRAPRRSDARFAVVGGGPAGLEAARLAAELGASVVLYERDEQLGGQLRLAASVTSRSGVFALVDHLEHEARRHGVDIRLETEATPDVLEGAGVDAIILACGAGAMAPPYPRDSSATVVSVWEVLAGTRPPGDRALVVDDGSGFWEAVSAAELLADAGVAVEFVTPAASVGGAIPFESIGPLRRRLGDRSVTLHPFVRVTHVSSAAVSLEQTLTGKRFELGTDYVAGHAGTSSNDELVSQLDDCRVVIRTIGDCVSPRRLTHANWDADRTVLELMRADARVRASARAWWLAGP
jgi:2,4-dienoyl-CoA reductase (NADPH2)